MRKPRRSNKRPTTFSPPLAMQQSVWDSIVNGNFINAKIFAFSRRSRIPGRVDTPKALFVNTHVLATACSYFQSTFSFSDGIETCLNAGLPPGVEPFFYLEECGLDSDFDDPVEGDPVEQPQVSPDIFEPPGRSIKTYVVKYTAYRTLRAIIWYIYTGEIDFSSDFPVVPGVSAKSVYRFADEHRMDHLKTQASLQIERSINLLSPLELVEEACSISCSVFTSGYPEWRRTYIERLAPALTRDSEAKLAFETKLSAYFRGELPHCKEIITSTLLALLDTSTIQDDHVPPGFVYITILRVSCPWPGRTKEALRFSLDNGILDDFKLDIAFGPALTTYQVHLAPTVMDDGTGSASWRFLLSGYALCELDFSPSTWQALAYYAYTGCITFKPLGSQIIEPLAGWSPSDTRFRGNPCSAKEMFRLACKLKYRDLMDLVTIEIVSSLTPENVVEQMFYGSPPPTDAINRGVEIISSSGNRSNRRIQSELREVLEEAATGSRLGDHVAFSAFFNKLL